MERKEKEKVVPFYIGCRLFLYEQNHIIRVRVKKRTIKTELKQRQRERKRRQENETSMCTQSISNNQSIMMNICHIYQPHRLSTHSQLLVIHDNKNVRISFFTGIITPQYPTSISLFSFFFSLVSNKIDDKTQREKKIKQTKMRAKNRRAA